MLRAAVDAVDPVPLTSTALSRTRVHPLRLTSPVYLVAAGKAAGGMAHAFCEHQPHDVTGLVSSMSAPLPFSLPPTVEWIGGAHPLPDEASERAGRRALELAAASRAGGTLVVLLSGGASAMLAVPAAGVTLDDKAAAAHALMDAGVSIEELNCVRKHLSGIKGGRLAASAGRTITLALSDVHAPIEDDPSVIGSGPTVPDPSTFADALAVIDGAGARVPDCVRMLLRRGAAGEIAETPKGRDALKTGSTYEVIGGRRTAMAGAAAMARRLGYTTRVLDPPTSGEAGAAGRCFFEQATREAVKAGRPMCVLASGETTVHVRGDGRGGRNQEFALSVVPLMNALGAAAVLASAGTDGIDGPTDAAGAVVDTATAVRARAAGLNWDQALDRNAAYDFFNPLEDLLTWGPTGTNVGDIHVLMLG